MKSFSILSTTFQTSGNYRNSACYNLGTTPVGILCNTVQSDPLDSKQLQLMVFSMLKVRSNHTFDNIKGIRCGLKITSTTSTYFACASLPEFCIAYVHQYFFFWFFLLAMHFTEKGRTACGLRVKKSHLFQPWFSYCHILRGGTPSTEPLSWIRNGYQGMGDSAWLRSCPGGRSSNAPSSCMVWNPIWGLVSCGHWAPAIEST